MGVGQGLRAQSPRGDGQRQQGTGERSDSRGQRTRAGESPRQPPPPPPPRPAPPVEAGPATLTILPRRLLLRLPVPTLALWQSASKPRIPPTPSPISTTWGRGQRGQEGQRGCSRGRRVGEAWVASSPGAPLTPDLPTEAGALGGAQEGRVGLVGAGDDCGHGALVSG